MENLVVRLFTDKEYKELEEIVSTSRGEYLKALVELDYHVHDFTYADVRTYLYEMEMFDNVSDNLIKNLVREIVYEMIGNS